MKALFLTQGKNVPSSRFRVQQLIPELEKMGISCTLAPSVPSTHGELEGWNLHGPWREFIRPFSIYSRLKQLPLIHSYDVVVIQKPLLRYGTIALERWITHRKPTLLDLDDAVFHNAFGLEGIQTRRLGRWVSHISAGNEYIANFFDAREKTTIIPTVVDTERYSVRKDPEGSFTMGWTGSAGNLSELEPYISVFKSVLSETQGRFILVCDKPPPRWMRELPVNYFPWSKENEVLALEQIHVGIMPLQSTKYNLGKCGFKLIQYMARGIPVVTSPVGANRAIVRNEVDGFWAESPQAWSTCLSRLARDQELRIKMGASARSQILASYSVKAVAPLFANALVRAQQNFQSKG